MERARLDKQLRVFDRECARNEFQIERQKRTIVTKFQSVALTTGHSEKALPPSGPQDSVYESSKHGQSRLSEKRLMEWKV
ncbi:hypothetical protein BaRGS_00011544 [Batillaria attramentaria]|uniref:Uncharacterized protein n=1 Tax=Batillaria attramentaria TaxID=370345 RepID=A0ABD0LCZ4_9CAEN